MSKNKKDFRRNQKITAPEVFLIDESGTKRGVLPTEEALQLAKEANLDLVEVAPLAEPPVCKIVDYGKLQYEQDRLARKNKAASKQGGAIKGIRLSVNVGDHDLMTRVKTGQKFLDKKNKVQIEIRMRGREKAHPELAVKTIERYIELLERDVVVEAKPKRQGGRVTALISLKK